MNHLTDALPYTIIKPKTEWSKYRCQMHKRNRMKIPGTRPLPCLAQRDVQRKAFSATGKFRECAHYRIDFSSYQSEYLPVFYSFPNGCCLFSTELWKTDEETVESSMVQRYFEGCFALLFCQHKTSFGKFRTVSFLCQSPVGKGVTMIHQKEKRKRYGTKNKNMAQ